MNVGSKVERIHPVAQFLKKCYLWIVGGWILLIPLILKLTVEFLPSGGGSTHGLGLFALLVVPFVANFFLLRLFPVYRITDCPYCGFHEKQRLGLSDSGEL